jgi:excisionase family DNA binding protein
MGTGVHQTQPDQLLTVVEVSKLLGVTTSCIRAWIGRRKIPFHKINRMVRIRMSTVIRLLAETEVPARPEQ